MCKNQNKPCNAIELVLIVNTMSVISNLLQKLGTTNDVEGVLQELKVTLYAIPLSQLQDAIRNVSFEPVFACFNSTRR